MVKVIGVDLTKEDASVTYIQIAINGEPFTFYRPFPEELPNLFIVEQYMVHSLNKKGFHPTACIRDEGFELYKLEVEVIPAYTYEGLLAKGTYSKEEVGRLGIAGAKGVCCPGAKGLPATSNKVE